MNQRLVWSPGNRTLQRRRSRGDCQRRYARGARRTVGWNFHRDVQGLARGVNPKLAVSDSVSLQAQVEVQTLDMAVVYEDEPAPAFARQLLFRQRLYLIYPKAKAKPAISITLSELAALPLILPSPPNVTRNAVDAAFKAAALTPNVVAEVDDLSSILASLRTGFGSTVCPKGDFP